MGIGLKFISRGKNGNYFRFNITEKDSKFAFAFVGCSAENSKSPIVKVSLQDPLPVPVSRVHPENQCKFMLIW